MGLLHGWVTDPVLGLTPNQKITTLGNGVLPLQAADVLLLPRKDGPMTS